MQEAESDSPEPVHFWEKSKQKYKTLKRKMNVNVQAIETKRMRVQDVEWGLFKPHCRVNVDQVPFNLDNNPQCGYFAHDDEKKQISGPPGADKRFGTLQVAFHPGEMKVEQPYLAMIFNGQGLAYDKEKHEYHPDVKVYFQEKATMDGELCVQWAQDVLASWSEKNLEAERFLLFADNLGQQKTPEFVAAVDAAGADCIYGPPNKTEGWQPIDTGHMGANLKGIAKDRFENWMLKDAEQKPGRPLETNWQVWERNGFSASEKRVMLTWIFGESWEECCSKRMYNQRRAAFEKGGCMITASGKNDHLVKVENHGPVWPPAPGEEFADWDDYAKWAWSAHPDFQIMKMGDTKLQKATKKAMAKAMKMKKDEEEEVESDQASSEAASNLAELDKPVSDFGSESSDERAKELQQIYDELFASEAASRHMEPFRCSSADPATAFIRTLEGADPRNS